VLIFSQFKIMYDAFGTILCSEKQCLIVSHGACIEYM
jgi:hypothetical protein